MLCSTRMGKGGRQSPSTPSNGFWRAVPRSSADLPAVALEELSVAEAAKVVDLDTREATARLVRTREFLRQAMTARVMVVEDNAIAAVI